MAILSIDQGTSATKALVIDDDGSVRGVAEVPIEVKHPEPGAVEVEPEQLLTSVLTAGRIAMASAGISRVYAVALANQGETVLQWDRQTGRPLSPAIVWQDNRSQSICEELRSHSDLLAARTGLVLDPYFAAPKLAWLRRRFGSQGVVTTSDSWLLYQLTGEYVTDAATASRSLVLDIDAVHWDDQLLQLFGLSIDEMPRVVANDIVVGSTTRFGPETFVAGVIVDQQAALLAERCMELGTAKCTYGTGAFLLTNAGESAPRLKSGLSTSVAWQARGHTTYCVDGQVYTAASALRWLKEIGVLRDVTAVDKEVAADSNGALFVPALAGLAAPWWRADAFGAFLGLQLSTTRGELLRAALEGIAASVCAIRQLTSTASTDTNVPVLRADGGLTQSAALMQIQADLLQQPVEVYPSAHATAVGAACLARAALDERLSLPEAVWPWAPSARFEPQWSSDEAASFLSRWRTHVEASLQ